MVVAQFEHRPQAARFRSLFMLTRGIFLLHACDHISNEVPQCVPCFTIRQNEPDTDTISVVPNDFTRHDYEFSRHVWLRFALGAEGQLDYCAWVPPLSRTQVCPSRTDIANFVRHRYGSVPVVSNETGLQISLRSTPLRGFQQPLC